MTGYLAENPGVPLALPRDLPRDLVWRGPESADHAVDGLVTTRSSRFTHREVASGTSVLVCVESPQGGATCPGGNRALRRDLITGDRVVIAFYGSSVNADEVDWWRKVPLEHVNLPGWVR